MKRAERILSRLTIGVLGGWFAASAVYQIPKPPFLWLRKWDLFFLIPEWKFFAPRPGTADYYLLYREQLGDGSLTDWTQAPLMQHRSWTQGIWNPAKREEKALVDIVSDLAREARYVIDSPELTWTWLQGTAAYLALLNFVSFDMPHANSSEYCQFLLMMRDNSGDRSSAPSPVILSQLHRLC